MKLKPFVRQFASRFDLFINPLFWWFAGILFVVFALSYSWNWLFYPAQIALFSFLLLCVLDIFILVLRFKPVSAGRHSHSKWSVGRKNKVQLTVENHSGMYWKLAVIDELPYQLQERNFRWDTFLKSHGKAEYIFELIPHNRGEYEFGNIRIFLHGAIGFFSRRITEIADTTVAVYPDLLNLKQFSLYTLSHSVGTGGLKRLRRLGHSYEFEQIKNYVRGDDMRHVNWKATGRRGSIMTNHYIEEKSQPVYCVIDKSRSMNMAFSGLTLLDHSVNASLVVLNTALQRGDKAGLITFSDKVGTAIRADNSPGMMVKLLDSLYLQQYRRTEADYEFLYTAAGRIANSRSLMFHFANFETLPAMQRVLPVLRKLNHRHLLVVVVFENAEVEEYAFTGGKQISEIYNRSIARQMIADKRQIAYELQNYGIQCIMTRPEELTLNAINKYLELKSKGLI